LTSPVWARASDTHGRKRMILLGLLGFTVSMLAFGLAVTAGLQGWLPVVAVFVLMVAARSVHGFFGSASPTAAQAYIADRTSRRHRTEALATQASAQGLGTVLGPAVAPFFVLPFIGLAGPMYVFALLGLIVFVVVRRMLPSGEVKRLPTGADATGKGLWKDPRVTPFLGYGFLVTAAQAVNVSVLGFHVIDMLGLPPAQAQSYIGVAMLSGAAATLLAQWGLIRLLRMGPRQLLVWGGWLTLAGNGLSVFAHSYFALVIGYALVSLGVGFARPGFMAGSSLAVGPSEQGAVAGLNSALAGFCFLAPPIIGVALYQVGEPAPFVLNVAMLLGAVALAAAHPVLKALGAQSTPETPPASTPGT
ncbi:MAG TPA: MFS transporter, partial [Caulobacteraceae bacterium]